MINEAVSKLDLKRCGLLAHDDKTTKEVDKMAEEVKERKPLPKFSCKISKGQFNSIEVKVYIPINYLKKVIG